MLERDDHEVEYKEFETLADFIAKITGEGGEKPLATGESLRGIQNQKSSVSQNISTRSLRSKNK